MAIMISSLMFSDILPSRKCSLPICGETASSPIFRQDPKILRHDQNSIEIEYSFIWVTLIFITIILVILITILTLINRSRVLSFLPKLPHLSILSLWPGSQVNVKMMIIILILGFDDDADDHTGNDNDDEEEGSQ